MRDILVAVVAFTVAMTGLGFLAGIEYQCRNTRSRSDKDGAILLRPLALALIVGGIIFSAAAFMHHYPATFPSWIPWVLVALGGACFIGLLGFFLRGVEAARHSRYGSSTSTGTSQ